MTLLIAISGGSGSGKSTVAEALAAALPDGAATVMREDWYYRDAADLPGFNPDTHDFDDVAARDHERLRADLQVLKAGGAVEAPIYSFLTHRREPGGLTIHPRPVVIVEGAHLLCDAPLAALFDLRVYVDTPADIRFIRRLLRDQVERGRSADSVIRQYLGTVRAGHERHVEPSADLADLRLADDTAAVRLTDGDAVAHLTAPLLAHPLLAELTASDGRDTGPCSRPR